MLSRIHAEIKTGSYPFSRRDRRRRIMADFGIEQFTDEDQAYRGSRFRDVVEALFANPYQRVWGRAGGPALPVYEVTLGSLARGLLPFGPSHLFRQAVERAVDSAADLRWGPDRKGFRR